MKTDWVKRSNIGIIPSVIVLMLISIVSYQSINKMITYSAATNRSVEVLSNLSGLMLAITDAETGERGYIITGDPVFLQPYNNRVGNVRISFWKLKLQTRKNASQQRNLNTLLPLLEKRMSLMKEIIDVRRDEGFMKAEQMALGGKGKQMHDKIRVIVNNMRDEENRVLEVSRKNASRVSLLTKFIIISGGILALILVSVSKIINYRGLAERQRAKEAFIISENHYRRLFETAANGILILEPVTGKILDVNPFLIELLGYSRKQYLEKAIWEIGLFEDIESNKTKFSELETKKYVHYENLPLQAADGRVINVEISSTVYTEDQNSVIQCNIRDLSERRLAEMELQNSEIQFWSLTENSPDLIARFDRQVRYLFANQSTAAEGKISQSAIIGKTIQEAGVPEPYARLWEDQIKSVFASGERLDLESSVETSEGLRYYDTRFVPEVAPDGTIFSVQTIAHDITNRKLAEEELRRKAERLRNLHKMDQAILQAIESPETIAQASLQHLWDLLQFQHASVGIFSPEEKEISVYAVNVNGNSIVKNVKILTDAALTDLEILRKGRIEIVADMGDLTPASAITGMLLVEGISSFITVPFLSAQGLYGVLNIGWDQPGPISEDEKEIIGEVASQITIALELAALLKESKLYTTDLEARVCDRTAKLEIANKELETFSYSVSHDLRAPLRHINGFIHLFLEHKTSEFTAEELGYLEIIAKSAEEMGNLIDALLSFSRLNASELQKTQIDSVEIINAAIQLFQAEIKARSIEIKVGDLPRISGDPQLISQVWVNFISNAVKYTGKKLKPVIEIGGYTENNNVVFFIKDNGAGFDMKYVDKLFGVFQRLHRARDFEGIGIGLANINRIITRHGGRCWAEGEIDKGAVFYFSLPVKTVQRNNKVSSNKHT